MSIFELDFDGEKVISYRLLDEQIKAVRNNSATVADLKRNASEFPSLKGKRPLPTHSEPLTKNVPEIVRKLTAISTDMVHEEEFVLGNYNSGYGRMNALERVYIGEEINQADLRIGNKGFGYSETEVYVAPQKPGIFGKLRQLVKKAA